MKNSFPTTSCALFLLCLAPLSLPAAAQERRVIPVTVVDRQSGRPVQGLTVTSFRSKSFEVISATPKSGPYRIVLLVDLSGSMNGLDRFRGAKKFVRAFLTLPFSRNMVALHAYAERHKVLVPLTRDRNLIERGLDFLPRPNSRESKEEFGYKTALWDALMETVGGSLAFGDVIVVLGDGLGDNSSQADVETVIEKFSNRGIRVFVLNLSQPGMEIFDPSILSGINEITNLLEASGGYYISQWYRPWYSPTRGDGREMYYYRDYPLLARIVHDFVKYSYRLEIELRKPVKKKKKVKLEIRDERGKRSKNVFVYYPRVLYPVQAKTAKK